MSHGSNSDATFPVTRLRATKGGSVPNFVGASWRSVKVGQASSLPAEQSKLEACSTFQSAAAISGVPAFAEGWGYDPTGNWAGLRQWGSNGQLSMDQDRVHDRGNRLTQIVGNAAPVLTDRAGRILQSAPDAAGDWGGRLELVWDAWSRIVQVVNNGGSVGTYAYDGLHRRITRFVSGVMWHSYYSDAWRPLEERKNSETTAAISYLWGARHRDDLARRDRAVGGSTLNETRYVLMDYFNPAAITDEIGEVKERYAFSAFGARRIMNPDWTARTTSESAFEFAFQGQFLDTESGLYNYGYRYYSPYLGRWACKDPIGERGGVNLYAFCANHSTNLVDHLGLISPWGPALWPLKQLSKMSNECQVGDTMDEPRKDVKCRIWCSKGWGQGGYYAKGTMDLTYHYKCVAGDLSVGNRGYWSGNGSTTDRPCDAKCAKCYEPGEVEPW